jgi:hypothetical protein
MKITTILEALSPSTYRPYRMAWNPKMYDDLFKQYATDKKHYRIYLPLEGASDITTSTTQKEVEQILSSQGYVVTDYIAGYALKNNRTTKIGKILSTVAPELQQSFANDPIRTGSSKAKGKLLVCISRHPYDIVGMSTGRGWTSCMNMVDGDNTAYIIQDVVHGTLIAYIIDEHDKNIQNPIGRMLIKPFIAKNNPKDMILVPEQRVYGANVPGFKETVNKWLSKVNHGKSDNLYCIKPGLYADSTQQVLHMPGKSGVEVLEIISKDTKAYKVSPFTFSVNKNGSVNITGNIYGAMIRILDQYNITVNKLKGDFDCSMRSLTVLPKCTPRLIQGDFDCSQNPDLASLDNAPMMVSGTTRVADTKLSLKDVKAAIVSAHYDVG